MTNPMMADKHIDDRLTELEIRLTHYEDMIESLNRVIIDQGDEIHVLKVQIQHLNKKLKSAQGSIIADEKDETPPPHY